MKYRYIAMEREYGSGGTEIARRLAAECGIKCYGREILEEVSKEQEVSIETIERFEENVTGSFLYTMYAIGLMQSGETNMLSREGRLFLAEQEVIRKASLQGPAIYLGHCAAEALKDKDVLKVYIRGSDKEKKHRRIREEYGIEESNIEATRKRFDNRRSKYYYANTTKKWEELKNYDMVLDSAKLGIEGCVLALKGLVI